MGYLSNFSTMLVQLMEHPPDPNSPVPTYNRPATMYGATIPFHILAWVAVLARLYTRYKIVREPGWDDVFVVFAALFNLASMVAFMGSIHTGMGQHLTALIMDPVELVTLLKWLYVQMASYYTTTSLIKVSLLCQYLRLFQRGALRRISYGLLVVVSLWGMVIAFMNWFPCFPPSGFWNRLQQPPPKCYGFGFGDLHGAYVSWVGFAASNMFFDLAIFLIPMAEYMKPGLGRKQVLAMTGLFTLGSIVILMAVLRLWTAAKHKNNDPNSVDFTWWYPLTMIFSCLEVDFAIMCASMPIFWPVIVASLNGVFVTKEVHVVAHSRYNKDEEYEMGRPTSLKSSLSQEGLTRAGMSDLPTNYQDEFVRDHVTGKMPNYAEVEVRKKPSGGRWKQMIEG